MVKRTSHKPSQLSSVARPLDVIGDGWSMLIVRDAFEGLTRLANSRRASAWPRTSWRRACATWWSTA